MIVFSTGDYQEADWSASAAYFWITLIYNFSYALALYVLALFYFGTHAALAPFRPFLKFLMIKLVIFLSYWQQVLFAILVGTGAIPNREVAAQIQDLIMCIEMAGAAVGMWFAFPYEIYTLSDPVSSWGKNALNALSMRDVVRDSVQSFAPTYQNYVMFTPQGERQVHRVRTFVPVENTPRSNGGRLRGGDIVGDVLGLHPPGWGGAGRVAGSEKTHAYAASPTASPSGLEKRSGGESVTAVTAEEVDRRQGSLMRRVEGVSGGDGGGRSTGPPREMDRVEPMRSHADVEVARGGVETEIELRAGGPRDDPERARLT